jgi:tetratricopeptide (TPR) repeat protein
LRAYGLIAMWKRLALGGLVCLLAGCGSVLQDDGEVALKQGRLDDAARQVQAAIAQDPGNLQLHELAAEIFTRRGERYYSQREMIAAAKEFETATHYDPMYAPAYDYLGMIAFWNHNWQGAIDYGNRATELEGRLDPPYVQQAKQELEKVKNGGLAPLSRSQSAKSGEAAGNSH